MSQAVAMVGEYSAHQREILLETVARGCSTEQFLLMLELAKKYRLDPFARQIWATPAGIFVGRDGFLVIAHRSGNFDGMETTLEIVDGKVFSATCTVWHKQMTHPIRVTVWYDEFYRPVAPGKKPGAWQRMPKVMLQKCAESHALRRAFCITGLYDASEFPPEDGPPEMIIIDPPGDAVNGGTDAVCSLAAGGPASAGPSGSGRCSRCGVRDPMIPAYREKYAAAFLEAGKNLPGDVCEECARELW